MKRLKVKDADRCMACLQCAVACASAFYKEADVTKACIRIEEGKAPKTVAVRSCIQCGKCAQVCPFGLIVMTAPDAFPSKCVSCGICAKQCPMEILEIAES